MYERKRSCVRPTWPREATQGQAAIISTAIIRKSCEFQGDDLEIFKSLQLPIAEELYNLYPRRVKKWEAIKAIKKALNRLPLELKLEEVVVQDCDDWIRKKTAQFAQSPAGQRGIHTPHPSTWFNQSRYLDDPQDWWLISDREESNIRRYREAQVGVWRPQ